MSTTAPVVERTPAAPRNSTGRGVILAMFAVLLAAHAPLLFAHFRQLWLKPHYQLFPLVLAGGFILLWPTASMSFSRAGVLKPALQLFALGGAIFGVGFVSESAEITKIGAAPNWVAAGGILMFAAIPLVVFLGTSAPFLALKEPATGRTLILFDLALLAGVVFFASLPGAAFSVLVVIASLAYTLGGRPLLRRCVPALVYLLLVVGPPLGLDTLLVQKLQIFAAKVSSKLLDQMGVFHMLNGVVISIGTKVYEVEGACSGISSLLSTLACVLFYVFYFQIHWLRATLLTLSAMFWVLVNNVLRIIGITAVGTKLGIDLSTGLPHQLFGLLLFALTLVFLWSTDRLLMFFGRSDEPKRRHEPAKVPPTETTREQAMSLSGAFYRSVPLAGAFAALAAVQVAEIIAVARQAPYSGSALSALYKKIDVATLPEKFGPWKRPAEVKSEQRPTGSPMGEFSQTWRYQAGPSDLIISFDYPYPEFHDIRVCYRNIGWQDKETVQFKTPATDKFPPLECVRVKLAKPYEQYAYLWFCQFDQDGVPMEPVDLFPSSLGEKFTRRLAYESQRWLRLVNPGRAELLATGHGSVVQVQMFFEVKRPLTDEETATFEKMFVESAQLLRAKAVALKTADK